MYQAHTIEELAEVVGIGGYLAPTVTKFNHALEAGTAAPLRVARAGSPQAPRIPRLREGDVPFGPSALQESTSPGGCQGEDTAETEPASPLDDGLRARIARAQPNRLARRVSSSSVPRPQSKANRIGKPGTGKSSGSGGRSCAAGSRPGHTRAGAFLTGFLGKLLGWLQRQGSGVQVPLDE
ncbi:MAG: hypothetical protein HPY83_05410 [Anaerolineae bacterium]|nr:hypothetical protein [Anaerolineae bacterium]